MAVGGLGLSYSDYYAMTPREIALACEGYLVRNRQDVELQAIAVRFGVGNALKGKARGVFPDKRAGSGPAGKIDPEEKRRVLGELRAQHEGARRGVIS